MLKWRVNVQTQNGDEEFKGKTDIPRNAPLVVECELPRCVIHNVVAETDIVIDEDEKIFMNGYQTWTSCPEYGKHDSIRGIDNIPRHFVKKYSLDRYGDYHFIDYPDKKGITHGFSWCYFRKGKKYRLFASLDEKNGYTVFTYDSNEGKLKIERDCKGLNYEGKFDAFRLYYAEGSEDEVFDGWFDAMDIHTSAAPISGYSSWYNRYENINEKTIRSDLEGCKTLLMPGDLFQIDDGWETAVGDWLEPDSAKFPSGLKSLADEIHETGLIAGLWLAPFACRDGSELMKAHPDWLLQVNGQPWSCGCNWGGFYSLDIDNPEVLDYLREVFERVFDEWGFDLVKLDFLYSAAPFGTDNETRAGRMIRAMDFLRKVCGDKLILGCGVPVMPAFGRVDYCRVSCDVSLDWDDKMYMRPFHRERVSTKKAIENTIARSQLNGRAYLSDPDVFFLRDDNIRMSNDRKIMLAKINALLGGVFLTSDDLSGYNEKQRKIYRKLLHLREAENVTVDRDAYTITFRIDGQKHRLNIPKKWFR